MIEIKKDVEGKDVFLKTKSGTQIRGKVIKVDVEIDSVSGITFTWINLLDKNNKPVVVLSSEIIEWVEK